MRKMTAPLFIRRPIIIVTAITTVQDSKGISKAEVVILVGSKIIVGSFELSLRTIMMSIRAHQVGKGPSHVLLLVCCSLPCEDGSLG